MNPNRFAGPPQPGEDLIDFAVSETFRDHYASQGLTYPSGRKLPERNSLRSRSLPGSNWTDEADTLRARIRELEIENRLLKLELQQAQQRSASEFPMERQKSNQCEEHERVFVGIAEDSGDV